MENLEMESIIIITSAILFISLVTFIILLLIWHKIKTKKMLDYKKSVKFFNV